MRNSKLGVCIVTMLLCIVLPNRSTYGQEVKDILPQWGYLDDANTALYKYFAEQAFEKLARRRLTYLAHNTKQDWLQRQLDVRAAYEKILGSFPKKTPLNPVITGVVTRDGVRVEKIYFESLPGYYVTGALFLPVNRKGRLPAIVYCSGHSKSGFRSERYQHMILNLVKKGFAVFAFDPIGQGERRQYQDNERRKFFGPTQEHSYPGSQHFLLGRSPGYYFIWDGIRAIDYLYTRSDIDTARIGITGRSGGGTQTAYIAAFDKRIKAAAPEAYITSVEKLLMTRGPQDAEQNFAGSLAMGLDMGDLLLCFAPKPLLLVTTTRDIFNIQGARDVFEEMQQAYLYLGKVEDIAMVEDDAEHESTRKNREATYRFFQKYLFQPGAHNDVPVTPFREKELNVTDQGNVYAALKGHNLHALGVIHLKEMEERRSPINGFDDLRSRVAAVTAFRHQQAPGTPIFSGRYHRENYDVESYLLKSITGSYIPVYWLKPVRTYRKGDIILLLDDDGKRTAIESGGWADSLALKGYEVVIPDLSGFGELASGYIKGGGAWIDKVPLHLWYMSILLDQSLLTVRMHELSFLIDWIRKSGLEINGVAKGVLTVDLLHIATMRSSAFSSLALINPLVSYQSLIEEANYKTRYLLSGIPEMIYQYDLGDLMNSLANRMPLLIIDPKDGAGETIGHGKGTNALDKNVNVTIAYDNNTLSGMLYDWYSSEK